MNIRTRTAGRYTIFDLDGPMNLNSMRSLQDHFEEWMALNQTVVVFNMSAVTLISSSGLGVLINFSQELKKRNGRLLLAGLHQSGKEVMAITKLDSLFQIFDSVEEALQHLGE